MQTIQHSFRVSPKDAEKYRTDGFLVLRKVFTASWLTELEAMVAERLTTPTDGYQKGFDRLVYDTCQGNELVYALLQEPRFRAAMRALTARHLFFTQGAGFRLRKRVSTGLAWHVEAQSFGFQRPMDDGATLWIPLQPIVRQAQRGGIRYVPRHVLSGEFAYAQLSPAVFGYLAARLKQGGVSVEQCAALRDGPLNSEPMRSMLEHYAQEDEFEVGDAVLMSKYLLHRSVVLEDGPLETRDAFALRFIDSNSRYDQERARYVEIPRRHYGYVGPTSFHLDVCERSGQKIVESPLFDSDREIRHLSQRQRRVRAQAFYGPSISEQRHGICNQ